MANPSKAVAENVPGDFFVDTTCIDCDTCRQLAPATFGEAANYAFVHHQPANAGELRPALQALLSCPTGSIGCRGSADAKKAMRDFPLPIAGPVYYCGFNSPKSYGGNSYFFRHPEGNWLVDSPKYLPHLVRQFEAWGGIAHIFLSHQDDVADAERYARRFASRRIIHQGDLASQPDAEVILRGEEPHLAASDTIVIPTPGHTRGHCVLLLENRFLFTGDHLYWDRAARQLGASKDYCWYSWSQQIRSMQRLLDFTFEWVLPGHGQRVHLPADQMRRELADLVARMKTE
jgi:glyoxylase-like metal-dependent hydrolase (beta-lactamase superfamily II)